MDDDTIWMYYKEEYLPGRIIDILWEFLRFHKDIESYEDFLRVFFRLEHHFIEEYLLFSYKETFTWRLYILFLADDEIQQYRNLWKVQKW